MDDESVLASTAVYSDLSGSLTTQHHKNQLTALTDTFNKHHVAPTNETYVTSTSSSTAYPHQQKARQHADPLDPERLSHPSYRNKNNNSITNTTMATTRTTTSSTGSTSYYPRDQPFDTKVYPYTSKNEHLLVVEGGGQRVSPAGERGEAAGGGGRPRASSFSGDIGARHSADPPRHPLRPPYGAVEKMSDSDSLSHTYSGNEVVYAPKRSPPRPSSKQSSTTAGNLLTVDGTYNAGTGERYPYNPSKAASTPAYLSSKSYNNAGASHSNGLNVYQPNTSVHNSPSDQRPPPSIVHHGFDDCTSKRRGRSMAEDNNHSYASSNESMPFTSDAAYYTASLVGGIGGGSSAGRALTKDGAVIHGDRDRSHSVASTAATAAFSESELRYFRKIFDKFDTDKSGSLGFAEIKAMCRHLGVEISDDELHDSIDEIDDNGNGVLEFDEFTEWLASMGGGGGGGATYENNASFGNVSLQSGQSGQSYGGGSGSRRPTSTHDNWAIVKSKIRAKGANPLTNQQINSFKEIFDHFDVDRSGTICRNELRGVFVAMGREDVSDAELDEIMAEVDDDRSGEIDFDEFLMLMCMGFAQSTSGGGGMGEDGSQSIADYLRGAFETCDTIRADTISIEDLRELMLTMCAGEMDEEEVNEIIRGCPKDDHNRVCFAKWSALWEACNCA